MGIGQGRACVGVVLLLVVSAAVVAAEEPVRAPDFYIGMGYEWDFAGDDSGPDFEIKFGGRQKVAPVFGLYDDRLLVGAQYMVLGTRAQMEDLYGGAGIIWYEDHFGGCASVGTHLSREWIIEATYRVTPDWDGTAEVALCYGFNW
jgi:hypothetical protein